MSDARPPEKITTRSSVSLDATTLLEILMDAKHIPSARMVWRISCRCLRCKSNPETSCRQKTWIGGSECHCDPSRCRRHGRIGATVRRERQAWSGGTECHPPQIRQY